jgi:cystathionine gamma-synthase
MTHDKAQDTDASAPIDLIRISTGLENIEDLIQDMESALDDSKK